MAKIDDWFNWFVGFMVTKVMRHALVLLSARVQLFLLLTERVCIMTESSLKESIGGSFLFFLCEPNLTVPLSFLSYPTTSSHTPLLCISMDRRDESSPTSSRKRLCVMCVVYTLLWMEGIGLKPSHPILTCKLVLTCKMVL